jgi:hypothetical protein
MFSFEEPEVVRGRCGRDLLAEKATGPPTPQHGEQHQTESEQDHHRDEEKALGEEGSLSRVERTGCRNILSGRLFLSQKR